MSETNTPDCPLCMETFEIDDLHFYPCTCGYQICRFCWHRIRTDENGLCPACRKTYTEDPAIYRPLSQDEIQKIKKERKQKEAQHKQKVSDNRQHLSNIRVIQRHLVFVVGLSNKMADAEVLKRPEYFGKYGKIVKIVINPNTNYAGPQGPSASAYITYTKEEDALKAILSINNMQPPLKIRASLGTTKYCTHYLRNMPCPKLDCMYLHDVGDEAASFTKEDMQAGKHQLFEKSLLDNYVANVQRQLHQSNSEHDQLGLESQRQLHQSNSEQDQLDLESQEDWGDEIESVDSLLPSNASWGTSKEIKNLIIQKPIDQTESKEYPNLESANIASPKSSVINELPPPPPQQFHSTQTQPITITKQNTNIERPVHSVDSPNDPLIQNSFSTGWATSTDTVPEEANLNIVEPANNFSWPGISDLGLSDLKIYPSDDELGFDPFHESKSGLEDLMASEKQLGAKTGAQPQPSFSWDSFWPSTLLNSYSLFGASQQMSSPHMLQYRPASMNPYQAPQMVPGNTLHMNPQNSAQFRFMNPRQRIRFPSQLPGVNPLQQQMHNQHFLNQFRFQQPPNQPPPPPPQHQLPVPITATSTPDGISTDNKNWQDGLRALLPNINISFANQQKQQQQRQQQRQQQQQADRKIPDNWADIDISQPTQTPVPEIEKAIVPSPPPGFAGFPGLSSEVKQPWLAGEKTGPRPPPPPGFGKPNESYSPPAQLPPGLLNEASGLHSTTPSIATTRANSASDLATSQSSHEDPSILWSKVLSDKPKEIEINRDMAFPLPGETLKQVPSMEANMSNHSVPQSSHPVTSWNTIVSGNQSKLLSKQMLDGGSNMKPLHVSAKDSVDMKPQKPSPIFGSQQKQAVKKPTAHVKPLKCNGPDGFTTVQNSRQPVTQTSVIVHTGSRISELDDFSIDLPMSMGSNYSQNVIGGLLDYPPVAHAPAKAVGRKKKKKGKEQGEQIAEVIVGRVETERPSLAILEDERPKKSVKTKKKSGQKNSPPQQRKSPPLVSKYEHQKSKEQQPPIRILKTDGNSSTTVISPTQTMADIDRASKAVSNSNHDQEIVSRLTESTEKLLKNVLFETEAIKLNTEQISKDLKSALEKCKESSLSLSDLEKINLLLTPGKLLAGELDDSDLVDTSDLERQVESARREAKMLEARLNDVIRKNMASELETLKRNTKSTPQ